MARRYLLLILTFACVPSAAAADSDGYFCSAPGLLAFDTFVPGSAGRIIKIVRFDPTGGIQPPEEVRIADDFQTHGIYCKPKVVEVYSWDHLYIIDISVPLAPKLEGGFSSRGKAGKPTHRPNSFIALTMRSGRISACSSEYLRRP